ncbi:MAG: hypothetical protein AAB434_05350 [Planctomycetota bacterium]
MRLALLAFLLALPLSADTVVMNDGRTLTGEVTEDGEKVVIKMKVGTIKVDKKDVKEIKKEGESGPAAAAGSSEKTYKSYLLGYVLHVPTTKYVVQRVPPEPLVDVILYDSASESSIALGVCSDEDIPESLDADAARTLGIAVKGGLDMYFERLDVQSAKAVKIGPFDTARVVLEGVRRDNKRKQHLIQTFFRLRDQAIVLRGEAVLGKHKALDADVDKIVETLESFEPKEMDGTTLVDRHGCFTVTSPEGWKVSRSGKPGDAITSTVIESQNPRCFVSVMVNRVRLAGDMRMVGQYTENVIKAATPKGTVSSSKAANLKGRVAWEVKYTSPDGPGDLKLGPCVSRALAFRTVDRVYYVDTTSSEADAKAAEALAASIVDSFEIYPDLLSKGSLENGREAVRLVREADEKRIGGGAGASIGLYDQAIELYPPFAGAYNNRGMAYLDGDRFDEAYKDMQAASELAPNDFMVSRNMAICRITKAYKSLDEGRITSAIDEADRLRGRAKDDEELAQILGIFYFQVGMHYYNQKKFGTAKAFFKKGMDFYDDKDAVKNALSIIALNEAVEALNKENWRAAKSLLEESLKYDPSNGQAKEYLDMVNEELSK